jgi:coenzyme F420-reducing hydrogenase delta subunit
MLIIKALHDGADAVLVSGCHPGDCHYTTGNLIARRRFAFLKSLLDFIGMGEGRVFFAWISASEGEKFAEVIRDISNKLTEDRCQRC